MKQSDWVATFDWVLRKDFPERVIFKQKPG